jgi:hypothetical protein
VNVVSYTVYSKIFSKRTEFVMALIYKNKKPILRGIGFLFFQYQLSIQFQNLTRQKPISLRRVPYKRRNNRRRLFQIAFNQLVKSIHIGVVRPRAVFNRVLDELKAWNARRVKRLVVSATCI